MGAIERLKRWAGRLKAEIHALYLAYKDPRVPWHARVLAACVVGYAFSPIDLILDPIPDLGYLHDLVLIPLGVALAVPMIPPGDHGRVSRKGPGGRGEGQAGKSGAAGAVVVAWLLLAGLAVYLLSRMGR